VGNVEDMRLAARVKLIYGAAILYACRTNPLSLPDTMPSLPCSTISGWQWFRKGGNRLNYGG